MRVLVAVKARGCRSFGGVLGLLCGSWVLSVLCWCPCVEFRCA
jgi:hypothetical protein